MIPDVVLQEIIKWGRGSNPPDLGMGICGNIRWLLLPPDVDRTAPNFDLIDTTEQLYAPIDQALIATFQSWSEFSGMIDFPVPSPTQTMAPSLFYVRCQNMWFDEYGKRRRGLCRHIYKTHKNRS